MKRCTLATVLVLLSIGTFAETYAQRKVGIGLTVGESVSIGLVPIPMYGAAVFYAVTPSIHAGLHLGFITGTSSGDSKAFDNLTAIEVAPYGKVIFGGLKDIRPFVKVSIAFINYNVKLPGSATEPGSSRDESNSSLWGNVGLAYDVTKSITLNGQLRFFDIGMTGKSKISYFGLASPAIGLEIYL